jgi:O-acetylhomoserine (thiol)-lyase
MGLDILELRVERSYENCLRLAEHFSDHPSIKKLTYPGLASSEYYQLSKEQFNGIPGTLMTFDLSTMDDCFSFMDNLKIIRRATNMNDNKSLVIHPWSTIYAEYPESLRLEMDVRDTLLRISVGIEDVDDLIGDIEQALT